MERTHLNITVVGAGRLAAALVPRLTADHTVRIASRTPGTLAGLAVERPERAVPGAQLVLLAVPGAAALDVAAGLASLVDAGATLLDCTNALTADAFTDPPRSVGLTALGTAQSLAGLGDWRVAKALNLIAAEYWEREQAESVAVPVCTDDDTAFGATAAVVASLGATPVPAGGLDRSALLEATAAFVMGQWFAGDEARNAFPPIARFAPARADA